MPALCVGHQGAPCMPVPSEPNTVAGMEARLAAFHAFYSARLPLHHSCSRMSPRQERLREMRCVGKLPLERS